MSESRVMFREMRPAGEADAHWWSAVDAESGARRVLGVNPHLVLAASAIVVLAAEYKRGSATYGHPGMAQVEAAASSAALLFAWLERGRVRLLPLLLLAGLFQLGWIAVHLKLGVPADVDSHAVYPAQGNALLAGHFPASEYPPGAVVLFALDAWIGSGATEVSHEFVMIPFQLATVIGVWELRTRWSPWFAAIVALWPANSFFAENKYDFAPTAFLVLGLVLALRERWALAGVLLGLGAWLKWTPALAGVTLVIWLLASGRCRAARVHALALAGSFLLLNLPFFLLSPGNVLAAYNKQADRGITAESVFYLPLHLLGVAEQGSGIWAEAAVPHGANGVAIVAQALILVGVFASVRARTTLQKAVTLAAIAPAAFLLSNRIYSPQFAIPLLATWSIAGSLLTRNAYQQLAIGTLALAATLVNSLVYPASIHPFVAWSAVFFLFAFSATAWAFLRARQTEPSESVPPPSRGAVRPKEHRLHRNRPLR